MKKKLLTAIKETPFWCLTALKGYAAFYVYLKYRVIYNRNMDFPQLSDMLEIKMWVMYFAISFYFTIKWRRTHLKWATLIVLFECIELFFHFFLDENGYICFQMLNLK